MSKAKYTLTQQQQESLSVGMLVETVDENTGMAVKILPSLTSGQSRKRNNELKRIKKFGY